MKKVTKSFIISCALLLLFIEMTYLLGTVDVRPIGPEGSSVGFSTVNGYVFGLTGMNGVLYKITEIAGMIPLATAAGFGLLGLYQTVKKRSLRGVDRGLLVLGGFYAAVAAIYLFFEKLIINYRPVILDEGLEASYPSTHTVLAVFIMSTAIMMLRRLVKSEKPRKALCAAAAAVMAVIVVGRLTSGVHWFTDICGGLLLSSSLAVLYYSIVKWLDIRRAASAAPEYAEVSGQYAGDDGEESEDGDTEEYEEESEDGDTEEYEEESEDGDTEEYEEESEDGDTEEYEEEPGDADAEEYEEESEDVDTEEYEEDEFEDGDTEEYEEESEDGGTEEYEEESEDADAEEYEEESEDGDTEEYEEEEFEDADAEEYEEEPDGGDTEGSGEEIVYRDSIF